MCLGSSSSPPPPPPPPPRPPTIRQPRLADEGVRKAQSDVEERNRRFAGLRGGTLLTSPGGLSTAANTQKKILLGGTA